MFISRKNSCHITKEIKDIKEFVELARRADIKSAVVKVNKKINANGKPFKQTKFKVRGSRYQYTLVVNDVSKAKKLQQSLPPSLEIKTL
ncbi:CIC11C00000000291 [Sungouiella intermedia]|uniref:Large ribosomal subunit protein eL38 n=1 Tax=Sungouiella intermedia TaxID=45354 RepID=A0A1L0B9Z7_9ASCO|nr:CIC11C00000000291 [[Candida] intermedia]